VSIARLSLTQRSFIQAENFLQNVKVVHLGLRLVRVSGTVSDRIKLRIRDIILYCVMNCMCNLIYSRLRTNFIRVTDISEYLRSLLPVTPTCDNAHGCLICEQKDKYCSVLCDVRHCVQQIISTESSSHNNNNNSACKPPELARR